MESTGAHAPTRYASIDALRGLNILLMIFVNDLAGVAGSPGWMGHYHGRDGMTFVDVVFPAFLFIVGMSIPFAFRTRRGREIHRPLWGHILQRTVALLVIGLLMVNVQESYDSDRALLPPHVWSLLMYGGVCLVWGSFGGTRIRRVRIVGVALLVTLALLFRGSGAEGLFQLRPSWWGIIGLIGWAYLVSCAVYAWIGQNTMGLLGFVALLYCVFAADKGGAFDSWPLESLDGFVDIGRFLGSHAAITLSGVVLGVMLLPDSPLSTPSARIRFGLLYGAGLALAAVLLHGLSSVDRIFAYNKVAATPPWCLLSSAFTVWTWVLIYWLMDVRGFTGWARFFRFAGENPLFAYILEPVFASLFVLIGLSTLYGGLGESFGVGVWRSACMAVFVVWLAGFLRKLGFRLKL